MSPLRLIEPSLHGLDHSARGNSTVAWPGGAASYVYFCPGETHPISRSVHLARLASGFSECRNCPHRHQQGALACPVVAESGSNVPATWTLFLTSNGVRGIYLNELDRTAAADWGAAFASNMWEEQPRFGRPIEGPPAEATLLDGIEVEATARTGAGDSAQRPTVRPVNSARRGPAIVIGFDERTSSPDIVVGVALGLRRMGCHVIDLGQTSKPCFHFAVHHLEAVAGIFVTGSGCDPAWTGFDLVQRNAIPFAQDEALKELKSRAATKVARPTRAAGSQRSFHARVPYEAGLLKFFHALRPLKIVCGTSSKLLRRTLESQFARLPCRLILEPLPVRRRELQSGDADVRRISSSVVSGQAHLGLIVDDDGERCVFLSETGQLVSQADLAALLIDMELRDHRSVRVILDTAVSVGMSNRISRRGSAIDTITSPEHELAESMVSKEADLGFSGDHRVWFRGPYPVCDAILTLARVLQAMSLSDAPMSDVLLRSGAF